MSRAPRVGETVCGYRLIRELGSPEASRYVASGTKTNKTGRSPPRVVVELFPESEALVRNARALAQLRHPKLVPVRDVVVEGGMLAVETDFIDGEWLADLLEAGWKSPPVPLGALLRILVDVLEGLGALHGARGPTREPLHLVHGEAGASHVLVGADGVARIMHPLRLPGSPSPEATGYLAPEVLLNDHSADARADIFSAGVLLWEILSGRRLHSATHAGEIVVRLLGGKVQLAEPPKDAAWAQPLAEVARRALSPELASRYATAADMIAAVRRLAGEKLGSLQEVRALVQSLAGERIRARASGASTSRTQVSGGPVSAAVAVAPAIDSSSPSVRPDTPTLVPPRSLPAPPPETAGAALDSTTLVAAAPAGLRPDPHPFEVEVPVELDSARPTALPGVPAAVPIAPKAPLVPTVSAPAPAVSARPPGVSGAPVRAPAPPARMPSAPGISVRPTGAPALSPRVPSAPGISARPPSAPSLSPRVASAPGISARPPSAPSFSPRVPSAPGISAPPVPIPPTTTAPAVATVANVTAPPVPIATAASPAPTVATVTAPPEPSGALAAPPAPTVARVSALPPLPGGARLSVPTPIIPVAAVAAFARSTAPSSPEPSFVAPSSPEPIFAPAPPPEPDPLPSVVVSPPPERGSIPEPTGAPLSLTAASDTDPPRARSRRYGALFLIAAVVVVLPAIAGFAWFELGRGGAPPAIAKQPAEQERAGGAVVDRRSDPPARATAEAPSAATATAPASSPAEDTPAAPAASLEAAQSATPAQRPAASPSASSEAVAPPPLKQKSKTTYYPLGI